MQRIVFATILFTLVLATACSSVFITPRNNASYRFLSNVPYLNRLVLNTSIGRDYYPWDLPFPLFHTAAAVSADGNLLIVGRDNGGSVSLFDLLEGTHQIDLVPSRNDGQVQDLEVKPDGEVSYSIDRNKADSWVAWLRFTPDASAFLVYRVASDSETMELFDRTTGQLLRAFPIEPKFKAGAVSPDGRLLLAAGASSLEYWDLVTGQKVGSVPLYGIGELSDLRCTPDGRFTILVPRKGNIRICDFRSMTEVASLPVDGSRPQIDISPDGRELLVVSSFGGWSFDDLKSHKFLPIDELDAVKLYKIRRYEIGTWKVLHEIEQSRENNTEYYFAPVRFSRDGNRLIAIGSTKIKDKKGNVELRGALFEFDLNCSNSDWQPVVFTSLPLHPDGKFLLDGREGSSPSFGAFHERARQVLW